MQSRQLSRVRHAGPPARASSPSDTASARTESSQRASPSALCTNALPISTARSGRSTVEKRQVAVGVGGHEREDETRSGRASGRRDRARQAQAHAR